MVNAEGILHSQIVACRRCVEAGYWVAAPPIVAGPANARLMVVGQAPGKIEASETRRPFSGPAGKRLFRWLAEAGWSEDEFRNLNYMTAITKCYPGPHPSGRGDRVASRAEQALCQPWLEQELALVQPQVVVPVGGLAIGRFLSPARLEEMVGRLFVRPADDDALTSWARQFLPPVSKLVPLPHPSGASQWTNQAGNQVRVQEALQNLRRLKDETLSLAPSREASASKNPGSDGLGDASAALSMTRIRSNYGKAKSDGNHS